MFSFLKRLNSPLPISGMHPARWLGWRHPRPREPGRSKTNSMILGHNCSCETAAVGMPRIHLPRKKSLLLFNVLMHISYNHMICIYIYIYISLSLPPARIMCVWYRSWPHQTTIPIGSAWHIRQALFIMAMTHPLLQDVFDWASG